MTPRRKTPLIFPDGVRLARADELPGPEAARIDALERLKSAQIFSGFCVTSSDDPGFSLYAEANVDAPDIWNVFVSLSEALLSNKSCLLIGNIDADLSRVGPLPTTALLELLRSHQYQLANDGSLQFGMIEEQAESVVEILVTPTKHFMIWTSDEKALRATFSRYRVEPTDELRFLDEFPRTIESLVATRGAGGETEVG